MHITERIARDRVRGGVRGHGMPRFGRDRLSNADLTAVLAYLRAQGGLVGESTGTRR
jgi:mono/diheme cytochrome c family protein